MKNRICIDINGNCDHHLKLYKDGILEIFDRWYDVNKKLYISYKLDCYILPTNITSIKDAWEYIRLNKLKSIKLYYIKLKGEKYELA